MTKRTVRTERPTQLQLSSGVKGLDSILNGGLVQAGTYALLGPAGAGKTIMANQICYHHAGSHGGRCVYVSLLVESHARLLAYLEGMQFYRREYVPDKLFYISGYQTLCSDGLPGLLRLLRGAVQTRDASMLVVDGLESVREAAAGEREFREFLHQLQAFTGVANCTTLLLSVVRRHEQESERVLADGVIELTTTLVGPRAVREMHISKFRGSGYLTGKHELEISDAGIRVYPRAEICYSAPAAAIATDPPRVGFGVPQLDDMLRGGALLGSTIALLGEPGVGKTALGLSFLTEGARCGQRGIYFGFREPPRRLLDKTEALRLDLSQYVDGGLVWLLWQMPQESALDALAERLLEEITRDRSRRTRLFIDGVGGFHAASVYPYRMGRFLPALFNRLRELGVTTAISEDLPAPRTELDSAVAELVHVTDGAILMRHVGLRSQRYRLISIVKMRETDYDPSSRELRISSNGIDVAASSESAEAILRGDPLLRHAAAPSAEPKRRSR